MIPSKRSSEAGQGPEPANVPDFEMVKKEAIWREFQLSKSSFEEISHAKRILERKVYLFQAILSALLRAAVNNDMIYL